MRKDRIGELVSKAMQGRSASAFAREMSVSHTTVANWLKGEHLPDLDSLAVIAKKAGITLEEAVLYILDKKATGDICSIQRQIRALESPRELISVIETATYKLHLMGL